MRLKIRDEALKHYRDPRYDRQAKKVGAGVHVNAKMLKALIPECKHMSEDEIISRIEGIDPENSTLITGISTEYSDYQLYWFDILYKVNLPVPKRPIFIHIELQNTYHQLTYYAKRGDIYSGALLSRQRGRVFLNQDYDKAQKVYSIWLFFSQPEWWIEHVSGQAENGSDEEDSLFQKFYVALPEHYDPDAPEFISMYSLIYDADIEQEKKNGILKERFKIPKKYIMEVESMCDASVIVAAKALEDGRQEGFQNGHLQGKDEGIQEGVEKRNVELILRKYRDGKSPESIAEDLYISLSEVQQVLQQNKLVS